MTTSTTTTSPRPGGIRNVLPHTSDFHGTWLEHVGHVPWLLIASTVFGIVIVGAVIYEVLKDRANRGAEASTAGLNYVVGPMGSGKSMFGVRTLVSALIAGKYAVTNVRFLDGWAARVVAHQYPRARGAKAAALATRLERLYVYETSLRQAMRYRLPCAVCGGDARSCGHVGPFQECRAVVVWDESHNDLNNRDYQGFGETREDREREKERRRLMVRWATQLRKLGYSGYLLSQHHENTDAQLRRVCNHIIRLQNQRQSEGLWLARLLPRRFTVFLAWWYPAHLATGIPEHMIKPVRRDRYMLPWHRNLYDSWETFSGIDAADSEDSPILLPPVVQRHGTDAQGAPRQRGRRGPRFALRITQSRPAVVAVAPGGATAGGRGNGGPPSQAGTFPSTDETRAALAQRAPG